MKKYSLSLPLSLIALAAITLSSCTAIGDIFKAGVWSGIIVVVIVVVLIIWLVSRMGGRGRNQ